ncbi:MAG: ATP-binding protein [Deltaproteobacteria bacterium]|nr:ATP-binding protein [Deltaproteobacteria bacterium]MBW2537528.1 ATP-binding protein [Deltaproteobacteria bacterium]
MEDLDVLAIAEDWSFWDGQAADSVPRNIDLPKRLSDSTCLVVQGVRRCGKSTLLRQMLDRYRLDPKRCAFLNLEDPRLANALQFPLLEQLVREFRARHRRGKRLVYFLDEIQAVEGWERWLRSRLDRPDGSVFVITGSNSTLLSGELSTVLSGRHVTVELFPFDLQELRVLRANADLASYLRRGGFPEACKSPDGDRLLRQYFHDIVERDIRERVAARSSRPIRQVAQMAFESSGAEMSLRRVAGGVGVAVDTAGSYLEACESAYLLFSVPYFAFSERKRASRNRKYYPIDTGLRRLVVTRTGDDRGKALECATHLALRKRHGEVFYWRGKGEVDFVVREGDRIVPHQVTWSSLEPRHHAALEEFYERFPQADEAVVVTAESFDEMLG